MFSTKQWDKYHCYLILPLRKTSMNKILHHPRWLSTSTSLYSYSLYHLPKWDILKDLISEWQDLGKEGDYSDKYGNNTFEINAIWWQLSKKPRHKLLWWRSMPHGVNNNISLNNSDNPCWLGSEEDLEEGKLWVMVMAWWLGASVLS